MDNLTSYNYNLSTPTSGTYEEGNVSYATASFIGSGSFGLTWGYEVCSLNGYTFITDSYTQSYSLSSSANPLFYVTATTSSADILDTINRLPDRINQTPFTNENTAINWIQSSGKYITLFTCSLFTGSIPFLLQENGSYILQENGDRLILNF
jgi:hypothetical protein